MSHLLNGVVDAGNAATRVGVWDDFSKPTLLRSTLTLPTFHATILLAALSTAISFTAPRAWRILRFLLFYAVSHRIEQQNTIESSDGDSDANTEMRSDEGRMILPTQGSLPSKSLVLLKNSETSSTTWLDYCGVLWKTRHEDAPRHRSRKSIVWAVAGLNTLIFIAASILSSQTVIGNSVVSKVTATCGRWQALEPGSSTSFEQQWNESMKADEYVRHCYSIPDRSMGSVFGCDKFNIPSISVNTTDNATCPWDTGICTYNDQSALALDTGNVSLSELGLNCRRCEEVTFRRRSVCSPLRAERFLIGDGPTEDLTETSVPAFSFNFSTADVYEVPLEFQRHNYRLSSMNLGVRPRANLSRQLRFRDGNEISHDPVLVLLTSSLGITFQHPTNDPIFQVTEQADELSPFPGDAAYIASSPVGIIGCDEQVQFCSQKPEVCGPWYGVVHPDRNRTLDYEYLIDSSQSSSDIREEYKDLYAAISVVDTFLVQSTVDRSIAFREGNLALQAARTMQRGHTFGQLAREQWKIEVRHWFSAAMAKLQHQLFDTIERRSDVDPIRMENTWRREGNVDLQDALCGAVRYHSSSHLSFSFFGIMTIAVACFIIVATSYFPKFLIKKLLAVDCVHRTRLGERLEARLRIWDGAKHVKLLKRLQASRMARRNESSGTSVPEMINRLGP
jgi:hypothetical protein